MKDATVHLVSIGAPFRHGIEQMERPPSALLYVGGHLRKQGLAAVVHHITRRQIHETARAIAADRGLLWAGLSVMTGAQVTLSVELSRAVKALRPECAVVWGGVHPSLMPAECLAFGCVDYVVVGEGERTAAELSSYLADRGRSGPPAVAGLAFLDDRGAIRRTADRPMSKGLDELRQDWSLVDESRYLVSFADGPGIYFITSRGCPHDCAFCYNVAFNRRRWRSHSADFVVAELSALQAKHGIRSVIFDDDNFLADEKRALAILERLAQRGIKAKWLELRIDYITDALVAELCKLGVESVFVGWESGSNRTLSRISKGFRRELILEKMAILGKYESLALDASAIIGFPWETEDDVEQTVSTALEMFRLKPFHVNFNLGLYAPYPGTPLVDDAIAAGFRFPTDAAGWSDFEILGDSLRLPWLTAAQKRRYRLLDSYAKVLHVPRGAPLAARVPAYAAALVAYARLRQGFLRAPVEPWLRAWAERLWLEHRQRRQRKGARASARDGSCVRPFESRTKP